MSTIYLDATLDPPRSLSPRGFNRVMLGLGAFSFLTSVAFLAAGAWPVVGFLGLEILLLWLVFRYSFRAQRARTYVRVTAEAVDVRKIDGWGRERDAWAGRRAARAAADAESAPPMSPMRCA